MWEVEKNILQQIIDSNMLKAFRIREEIPVKQRRRHCATVRGNQKGVSISSSRMMQYGQNWETKRSQNTLSENTWTEQESTVRKCYGAIIIPFRLCWENSRWGLFPTNKLISGVTVGVHTPHSILSGLLKRYCRSGFRVHLYYFHYSAAGNLTGVTTYLQSCEITLGILKSKEFSIFLLWLQISCSVTKNIFFSKILKSLIFNFQLCLPHCSQISRESVDYSLPNVASWHSVYLRT